MSKSTTLITLFNIIFYTFCGQCSSVAPEVTTKSFWHRKSLEPSSPKTEMEEDTTEIHFDNKEILRMATPCLTPNDDPGYCVEIQKCQSLYTQIDNSEADDFLRKSKCGPSNENPKMPKVCCGKYNNFKHLLKKSLPTKCGNQSIVLKSRIMGGQEAQLKEFPWMARLIHKNKDNIRSVGCAGFLIHSKFVMTAAHCLDSDYIPKIGPAFEVQLGEYNVESEIDCNSEENCAPRPQKIRVLENIVHPKYNKDSTQHHYDIGLIYLKKGAKMSDFVYPICLLEENLNDEPEFWISGWGKTETLQTSQVKMKLSLPFFNFQDCVNKYKMIDIGVIKSQICAGGLKNKDSCSGDSGGPLMVPQNGNYWFAAGVVSFGLGCGREGWPGVYTYIPSYIDWIKANINKRANYTHNKKDMKKTRSKVKL